ncbi:MAG: serine hydrolase [Bacteroidota bacterium]
MKIFKKLGWLLLVAFILFNTGVILFGKTYFYTAIAKTYLSGQSGPGIYDLKKFDSRTIPSRQHKSWKKASDYNTKAIGKPGEDYLNSLGTKAFLVVRNGELFHEQYFDEHTDTTVSNSFSMAKSIVAMLTQIAHQEGYIASLQDPVNKYLKEFNKPGCEKVTLEHLMSMTSGLTWTESSGNPFSDNAEAYYGTDLTKLVEKMTPETTPGKEFEYKSGNTALLALALERAIGMPLSEYAALKLWQPLAAEHDAYWSLDHDGGTEKAYCCWYATATDFARLGQLMLQEGHFNGKQLLDSSFVAEARTAAPVKVKDGGENSRYSSRSFWLVQHKGKHYYYLRGILGQYIIILPEENAIAVRLGKKREEVNEDGHPLDVYRYIDLAKELLH